MSVQLLPTKPADSVRESGWGTARLDVERSNILLRKVLAAPIRGQYSSCILFSLAIVLGLLSAMLLTAQTPPTAPRIEHREARHGATVIDDYFWLREKSNPKVSAVPGSGKRLHRCDDQGPAAVQ